ncbi:MAG: DNA translocase FtsK, partial [Rhodothermales bacterium]
RRAEKVRLRKEPKEKKREQQQPYVESTREAGIETSAPIVTPPRRQAPAPPLEEPVAAAPHPSINDPFRQQRPPTPAPVEEPPDLELNVYGQVEEEKAHEIAHDAEVADETLPFEFPPIDLLDMADEDEHLIDYDELEENKRILLDKLATYNIEITNINAIVGPTVTLYELTPAPGIKISRITALEDDMAMAMAARGIRMIAPIPGKTAIGVEIPNRHRELVRLRDVIGTARFRDAQMELPVALGKTIEGEVFLQDLAKMPHLLIAGATGSGKSVGLNTLIAGLLYACHPSNLKFVMIDPKKIELQQYREILDHYLALPEGAEDAIITDVADALGVLKGCEKEMEQRYDLLSNAKVRGVKDYNKRFRQGVLDPKKGHHHLPHIVVIVDELADLMMTAGKEIEAPIARLAQMARAVGIHLVLATQRPSVDVITGLIKANFPSRVAYQVASKIDARTILDQNGAEGLVGNGDMLYMSGSKILRLQGPFVSVDEIDRLMEFIADQPGSGPYILPPIEDREMPTLGGPAAADDDTLDDLFEEAARIIVRNQQGSVSLLQRKLSVGYTRAARIVDQLEEAGVVGAFIGSKAREVLVADEMALDEFFKARVLG